MLIQVENPASEVAKQITCNYLQAGANDHVTLAVRILYFSLIWNKK